MVIVWYPNCYKVYNTCTCTCLSLQPTHLDVINESNMHNVPRGIFLSLCLLLPSLPHSLPYLSPSLSLSLHPSFPSPPHAHTITLCLLSGSETHFKVVIVSTRFQGLPLIKVLGLIPCLHTRKVLYSTIMYLC